MKNDQHQCVCLSPCVCACGGGGGDELKKLAQNWDGRDGEEDVKESNAVDRGRGGSLDPERQGLAGQPGCSRLRRRSSRRYESAQLSGSHPPAGSHVLILLHFHFPRRLGSARSDEVRGRCIISSGDEVSMSEEAACPRMLLRCVYLTRKREHRMH